MTPGATLPIGGKPAGIAVSRDGARAYVTSPEGHFVSVIDAKARRVLKRIAVVGQPFGVAVSPDGRRLYVADMNGRDLLEIDPDSEKTRRVEIGAMPSGVAVTPDGRLVIAAARDDNALVVIDATVRLLEGAMSDLESARTDSFFDRELSAPSYTRPPVYRGHAVPEVLLSGDHKRIDDWRRAEGERLSRDRRSGGK